MLGALISVKETLCPAGICVSTLGPVFSMRFVELVFFEEGEAEDLWDCVGGGVEVGGF